MRRAIGIFNGNFRDGIYGEFGITLTSPRDEVLAALKAYMGDDFGKFFNKVYGRYRQTDEPRYERLLRYVLKRYEQNLLTFKDMFDDLKGSERTAFEILLRVDDTWTMQEHGAVLNTVDFILDRSVSELDPLATVDDWAADRDEDMNRRPEVCF